MAALYSTALHMACFAGDFDTVKFLVEQGADLNAKNVDGLTPLQVACNKSEMEIVRFMIEKQMEMEMEMDTCNDSQQGSDTDTGSMIDSQTDASDDGMMIELPPAEW